MGRLGGENRIYMRMHLRPYVLRMKLEHEEVVEMQSAMCLAEDTYH